MTTVTNTTASSSTSTNSMLSSAATLDSDMFMKLFLAQLKNQDPTNPTSNAQLLQQLSEMSNSQSLQSLQSQVEGLAYGMNTAIDLQATSMVGKEILFQSNTAKLTRGGKVSGQLNLSKAADDVTLHIYNSKQQLVDTIDLGNKDAGAVTFTLEQSKLKLAPGTYTISASGMVSGASASFMPNMAAKVDSVELTARGVQLVLDGAGTIPITEVTQITGDGDDSFSSMKKEQSTLQALKALV